MTLVSASTKIAMSLPLLAGRLRRRVRDGDGRTSGLEHGRLGRQLGLRDAGVEEDLATLLGVGAVEADDDRGSQVDAAERLDDALGHLLAAGDAAEGVDEDR